MESRENSPALSSRGFKSVLTKARRGRTDNASSTSMTSSNLGNDSPRTGSIVESTLEANGPIDGDHNVLSAGINKLLPARIKNRVRKRRAQETEDRDSRRGRSATDMKTGALNGLDSPSQTTLDDDGESSLLTDDSGEESPSVTAPPLASHASHVGYLTSSSPAIKAVTLPGPSQYSQMGINAAVDSVSDSYSTADVNPAIHDVPSLGPSTAATTYSLDSTRSRQSSNSRSVSPGTKSRTAAMLGAQKGNTLNKSPEQNSAPGFGSGPQPSGYLSRDKKESLSSRRASKNLDEAPPNPQPIQTRSTPPREPVPLDMALKTPTNASSEPVITTVTPPTPVDRDSLAGQVQRAPNVPSPTKGPNAANPVSGNLASHRRSRSDSITHQPSKLSNAMSAPLTPTIEEKTPPPRSISGSLMQPSGFFSSVIVAAQNAANTFSNTMGNNQGRSRSGTQQSETTEDVDGKALDNTAQTRSQIDDGVVKKPKILAINTMGNGDLSLSHLGILNDSVATSAETVVSANGEPPSGDGSVIHRDEVSARVEDIRAARAVSVAYGEKSGDDVLITPIAEDAVPNSPPKSAIDAMTGEKSPLYSNVLENESGGLWRSGSLRSKIEKSKKRHRNSSGATGTTIGAAVGATHGFIAAIGNGSTPKLTGFAVAPMKRNRDFHQLFRSVPEDDYLIEDYSCALQRDIILAGRIYISEGHICFSSNILGWVTSVVVSFDEVVSIEKESTAVIFPNAIAIQTLHARHTFRSLLTREATYDLLIGIWKVGHPSLQSSENGVKLVNGGTGSKTEKVEPSESDDASEGSDDEQEVYDQDEEDDDGGDSVLEANGSIAGSELADPQLNAAIRKVSAVGVAAGQAAGAVPTQTDTKAAEKATQAAAASSDYPGPASHAPTECSDGSTHYEKPLKDEVFPAPLGKIYSMLFGAASGGFVSRLLIDEVKVFDLQMEDDKKGLSEDNKTRTYTYIKPLPGSLGPRQTKCIVTETLESLDLEKAASVTVTTQTPDVPSGNVFCTKARYCLMWGPGNGTRLIMTCTVEWTGKSWLKGPIEKGASDGQTSYSNDLVKALRAGVSSRLRAGTITSRTKKGRKRKGEVDGEKSSASLEKTAAKQSPTDWGLFEPVHGILSPAIDIFQPLLTAQSLVGLLLFLLIITWFRNYRMRTTVPNTGPYPYGLSPPHRLAAYEQIWHAEESALWDWLDERVGVDDGFSYPTDPRHSNADQSARVRAERRDLLLGKGIRRKVEDGKEMSERELDWAIEATERKLKLLREVEERGRGRERKGVDDVGVGDEGGKRKGGEGRT